MKGECDMYCYKCGNQVDENAKFCPNCGTQLNNQQTSHNYEPIYQESSSYVKEDDAPSFLFALLSFVIPVVGLVLFILWNKEYPQKAKSCLKGFVANIILDFVMGCCVMAAAGNAISHEPDIDWNFEFNNAVVEVVPYESYY